MKEVEKERVQDPEDREIEYLERKLGLRGGKKARKSGWKRLEKDTATGPRTR